MTTNTYLVKTVSGKEVPRNKTRYISKEYHEINEDCFFMSEETGRVIRDNWRDQEGRWHRKDNGQIDFDHENKDYVLLSKVPLMYGIVGLDDKGEVIQGYMSPNKANNVIFDGSNCISYKIPEKRGALEDYSSGSFYSFNKTSKNTSQLQKKGIRTGYQQTRINYSASNNMEEFVKYYDKYYEPDNTVDCSVAKELNNKSFGKRK